MQTAGLVLTWLVGVFAASFGGAYLARHAATAAGFGIAVAPAADARAWWQVKGIRDLATGLLMIAWAFIDRDRLGWLVLILALIPAGDGVIVWGDSRNLTTALGVHGATAAVMIIAAVLLLLGR